LEKGGGDFFENKKYLFFRIEKMISLFLIQGGFHPFYPMGVSYCYSYGVFSIGVCCMLLEYSIGVCYGGYSIGVEWGIL
jgi:hypothetical protein